MKTKSCTPGPRKADDLKGPSRIKKIQSRLNKAMLKDEAFISGRLKTIKRKLKSRKPNKTLLGQLDALERKLESSIRKRQGRLTNRPGLLYPEHLPIFARKDAIVEAINKHQVVVISGDTGSGKSTQIPKMCLEAGRGITGKIACTQPRRIAATAIARRIAEELGEKVGPSVGYKIRFSDRTAPNAYIKIMTDGMLLAETQNDPFLYEYDTIIIDEAHERSLNIDFLLGILRTLLAKRKTLKIIITSATLDTEKFSEAFGGAPVITIEGRLYPVEVRYHPPDPKTDEADEITHVDMAVRAVEDIQSMGPRGDVLIFMPTEQDIRETCELLEARKRHGLTILPLFARLTAAQQKRVFASFTGQKIVVATNVAETSLTIPGIKYVIDTGLARIPRYLPRTRSMSLAVNPISKSSADQRKGRCGRVENGICIRLYSEEDLNARPDFTPPEIVRSNLAEVILRMFSLNLGHIASFPFIDRPNQKSIKDGFDLLVELGAIEKQDKHYILTQMGKIMAKLPMDPRISRMMLEAQNEGCAGVVAVIASGLSIQDPRERPYEKADQADQMHALFQHPDSDFLSLLNIWHRYHRVLRTLKTQNQMRKFCKTHFLSFVRMREWRDIHHQILAILNEQKISVEPEETLPASDMSKARYAGIHRAILSGYLSNFAVKKDRNFYQAARGREVMLFPGSTLFNKGTQWIVAAEMVKTTRLFARTNAKIDSRWLEALGGKLCKSSYTDAHWEKNRGEVRASEHVNLFGLRIVSGRPVSYGPIDPMASHNIFIQSALVEGQVKEPFPFLKHNRRLIERLANMEDRIRRRDILVSEHAMAEFYSEKLQGISDIRALKNQIRQKGGDHFLNMKEEDLTLYHPDPSILGQYPDHLDLGEQTYRFSYKFAPTEEDDGVTIAVPSTMTSRFPLDRLEWMVPGLFRDKIAALIKGLPKRYRKQLVPVSKHVDIIAGEMPRTDESLITALARFIYQRFGVDIPASEWPLEEIPEHLKMRIAITDHKGRVIRSGRDAHILMTGADAPSSEEKGLTEARLKWEQSNLKGWTFGTLPEQISVGPNLMAYPGLEPGEACVHLKLFTHADKALQSHRKGVEFLFSLYLSKDFKYLRRILKLPQALARPATLFWGLKRFEESLYQSFIHRVFRLNIRTEKDFLGHAETVRPGLVSEAKAWLAQAENVLLVFSQTHAVIRDIESANRSNKEIQALCTDIRHDLDRLVPHNFLDRYEPARLFHIPRYLKALAKRAERGSQDVGKDKKKAAELAPFSKALQEMKADREPKPSREKIEELETFRWMIEEYRVSLFAQELKTPYPISSKRLRKKLGEIQRMR